MFPDRPARAGLSPADDARRRRIIAQALMIRIDPRTGQPVSGESFDPRNMPPTGANGAMPSGQNGGAGQEVFAALNGFANEIPQTGPAPAAPHMPPGVNGGPGVDSFAPAAWEESDPGPEDTEPAGGGMSVTDRFIRKTMRHTNVGGKDTKPPEALIAALRELGRTSVGMAFYRVANGDGPGSFTFTENDDLGATFAAFGNAIDYTTNVKGYMAKAKPCDEGKTATLAVLIAHEIGHTDAGRASQQLPNIKISRVEGEADPDQEGDTITIITDQDELDKEETRAVTYFENPVRQELGLPLRKCYLGVPVDPLLPGSKTGRP